MKTTSDMVTQRPELSYVLLLPQDAFIIEVVSVRVCASPLTMAADLQNQSESRYPRITAEL